MRNAPTSYLTCLTVPQQSLLTIALALAPALYIKLVEWSEDDQRYIGSSPGFIGPCCHGKDEAKVYKQLCGIVEEWVEIHQQDGIPLPESFSSKSFSGKFVIRVGKDLHKALAIKAAKSGESLNNFCTNALQNSITG